jgi:hypothetical protein
MLRRPKHSKIEVVAPKEEEEVCMYVCVCVCVCIYIYIYIYIYNAPVIIARCETTIFSADFLKILKYKISRKSIQWSPVIRCGRTDRHDKANSTRSCSQFRELTSKGQEHSAHTECSLHDAAQR